MSRIDDLAALADEDKAVLFLYQCLARVGREAYSRS